MTPSSIAADAAEEALEVNAKVDWSDCMNAAANIAVIAKATNNSISDMPRSDVEWLLFSVMVVFIGNAPFNSHLLVAASTSPIDGPRALQ